MSKTGFIGVGVMGRPMAAHLQAAGHDLFLVKHRNPLPPELLEGGALECASCKEVAERAGVIILMVPDTPDVAEVLFGPEGVADGLSPGKTVIDMSTISPLETRKFAARINELDCDYLDAPVSGGEVGARNGTLTIMVGGPREVFERSEPLLRLLGKNITLVGDSGAGQTCKMANQIIVALTIEAVGEALLLAARAGVDPARVREALMGGFAGSRVLEIHGERMIQRTFEPGFRIELQRKDLDLALAAAGDLGVSLPNTVSTRELLDGCIARGWAALDHSALVRALEVLADHQRA